MSNRRRLLFENGESIDILPTEAILIVDMAGYSTNINQTGCLNPFINGYPKSPEIFSRCYAPQTFENTVIQHIGLCGAQEIICRDTIFNTSTLTYNDTSVTLGSSTDKDFYNFVGVRWASASPTINFGNVQRLIFDNCDLSEYQAPVGGNTFNSTSGIPIVGDLNKANAVFKEYIFENCNIQNVESFNKLCCKCTKMTKLSFKNTILTTNSLAINYMLNNCTSLQEIWWGYNGYNFSSSNYAFDNVPSTGTFYAPQSQFNEIKNAFITYLPNWTYVAY